jgi:hypothetical protein
VCASGLAPGDVQTHEATFPKTPREVCGEGTRACTVRAVPPDAAEAVAASWKDELGAPRK